MNIDIEANERQEIAGVLPGQLDSSLWDLSGVAVPLEEARILWQR